MSEQHPMILHHYEMSPFSEKIRLMFGFSGLSWQSLQSPEMPPRPNVDPLSGGYRRIPIAQLGADIFCDSRLIAQEVAALGNVPGLALSGCTQEAQDYSAHLESHVFWATVFSIPIGTTLKQLYRAIGLRGAVKFLVDRAGVGKAARMNTPSFKEATTQFDRHLSDLEQRLQGDFLFGDSPCHADFAAYHTLWFKIVVAELEMPAGFPRIEAWYRRMGEFGHGQRQNISQADAFAAARDAMPRPLSDDLTADTAVGSQVAVLPSDYALDSVRGILVGSSEQRWVVARDTEQFGTVHVHFPRQGFELTPI
ncbi:MAG: glutathione S-transferase family protein [Halioglobus sp.]